MTALPLSGCVLAVLLTPVTGSRVTPEDLVENPVYVSWAGCGKGTTVTLKTTGRADDDPIEGLTTQTLTEVTDEKVVLEVSSTQKVGGGPARSDKRTEEIKRLVPLPAGVTRERFAAGMPPDVVAKGDEPVEVGGRKLRATWYKWVHKDGDGEVRSKAWYSPDCPGRLVRLETSQTGKTTGSLTVEVTSIAVKK